MKIGDFVEQYFTSTIIRRGVLLKQEKALDTLATEKYWLVSWLPHPDLPMKNNNIYSDVSAELTLKVISSI
jgi:hypothetical protein